MTTPLERVKGAQAISALLDTAAEIYQSANAFTCGPMSLSYSDMAAQGTAFAGYLQSVGVGKGDRVALMTPNLPAFPIATLGILKCGAVQVNVNPLYTAAELEHQLNDAGAETLVIFAGTSEAFASIRERTCVKRVIVISVGDGTGIDAPSPPPADGIGEVTYFADALDYDGPFSLPDCTRDDLAFLQYTGGTTGPSKGAMLTHGNILANIEQIHMSMPEIFIEGEETIVTALPLYHIFALTVNFLAYTCCGGRNLLVTNPRDMDGFVAAIRDSQFTVMTGVNTLYAGLTMQPAFADVDFSKVKATISGGTAAMEATSDRLQSFTGIPLIQGYGLSETSPVLTMTPINTPNFTGKIGFAVKDTDIKLVDNDDKEVPLGERGELVAKGPQVTQGYYEKEDATREAFTSDGYFRTGDIAIADAMGSFQIVDRKKDMVIVSGFNVYPNDVEQVASKCPGVVECACLGVPDEKTGEAVKLFVVKEEAATVSAEEIIAHCREHMTAYKVPKQIAFIDEVPKSAVGKMLRRVLRDA